MAGFSATAWINASPQQVYDFMLEPTNVSKVMPNITRYEKLTDGPVRVGTRYRETRLIRGQEATSEIEVTAFEPSHRYAATSIHSGITTTYDYRFAPENDGTRVDLTAEVSGAGIKKLIVPVVVGIIKKEDGDHLMQLKTAVEESGSRGVGE